MSKKESSADIAAMFLQLDSTANKLADMRSWVSDPVTQAAIDRQIAQIKSFYEKTVEASKTKKVEKPHGRKTKEAKG